MAPDAISGCKALLASDAADLEFGASLEQLGAASYGEGKEPWGGENVVSPSAGGYSALVELLRERIELERSSGPSCSIRTGVAVTGIELGTSAAFPTEKEGGVIVELSNGERLHTAFAINTLPLGVLQQRPPTFRPQLSNQKRRSLHALGVGLLNKVILIYSVNFWQGEDAGTRAWLQPVVFADGAEERSPALPEGVALEYWNGARFGLAGEDGSTAVVLLVGAELAKEWEKDGSNTRIVERADELFRRMFPGAASEGARLVASRVTRWQNETWSRGSYSFLPPGALPSDRTALCAPDGGALFWAGEHCSLDFPATTHDGIEGYVYTPGRGIVIIGDGCFVPLAYTSAYLLAQYNLNLKVALFTSAEGVGTAAKLAAVFGQDPFERVVDATALLDKHDVRMKQLGRNRTCGFRLQKIIAHIYAPFDHSLIMDADNFPCSSRVKALFDAHDVAGSQAMLMYDPTRPGVFNGGFQLAKRTPEVRRFKVHWLKKVAHSCHAGIHIRKTLRGVNYVLDQPDMNYLIERWTQKVNSTKPIDVIAPDLQACRPEMWAGGEETERYLQAMGQPGNLTLLDYPPCPFAHINPFKFPWFMPEKVDAFCSVRGLGDTSTILYRVMEVAFNETAGLGISAATARWCLKQVRGTREDHDTSPHFIDGR